jgi:hypothetical protein
MPRSKAPAGRANRPRGEGASDRRSGQGAGSALQEMLRRQSRNPRPENPRPGAGQPPPVEREKIRPPLLEREKLRPEPPAAARRHR